MTENAIPDDSLAAMEQQAKNGIAWRIQVPDYVMEHYVISLVTEVRRLRASLPSTRTPATRTATCEHCWATFVVHDGRQRFCTRPVRTEHDTGDGWPVGRADRLSLARLHTRLRGGALYWGARGGNCKKCKVSRGSLH